MKLFVDSGNIKDVEALAALGVIDGATTNPSLLAKAGGDPRQIMKEICRIVQGPVSGEVVSTTADEMVREGREIAPCLPAGRHVPARELIGPDGERWVPTAAVVPLSMAETAATRVRQLFGVHRARMQGFGMWESCTVVSRPGAVIIEPCIYWHDELSPVHLEQPDVVHAGKSGSAIHFPEGRELAIELRARLTELFTELGAVHLEPGKAHPFRTLLAPQAAEALERLRQAFDPDDRLNPGNLER